MRKKNVSKAFLLILLAGIVYACMEEGDFLSSKRSLPPEVSAAQKWYESQTGGEDLMWKSVDGNETNTFTPDWTKAFWNEDKDYRVTEVHLIGDERLVFLASECADMYQSTGDERYNASDIRLVIRTNKETKETDGFIMILFPDLDYLEKNRDHPLVDMSYLKRNKDFGGIIYYHDMEGNFVNGWKYTEGVPYAIYPAKEVEKTSDGPLRSTTYCDYVCVTTEHYVDWYVNGDFDHTQYKGTTTSCYYTNCWTDYSDSNSGGYGGGGGGSTNTGNTTTSPKAKKIFRNSNMTQANWEKLEKMIDKIMQDCMGSALYNGLVDYLGGKTLTIQFGTKNEFTYDGQTAGIMLKGTESNRLFHEMLHAYQAYNETNAAADIAASINNEIETRYAQYLYVSSQPEYSGSTWEKEWTTKQGRKEIAKLSHRIDSHGKLKPGVTEDELNLYIVNDARSALQVPGSVYANDPYNYERIGTANFKNLNKLTKDC
ncbi:hypothetical protein AGMMS50262_12710 [Bacteroidia bacterium]|nr:hypothetical protein AGMMS50262_12710 [Bacteroidia bacterium]